MPIAHLIHGFLGSGKTTFARRLERDVRAIRFTHDEWMVRLYGHDPPADQFPILFHRVSEQIDQLWPRCLELGADVVLDHGFWSCKQREETRALACAVGASTRLYRSRRKRHGNGSSSETVTSMEVCLSAIAPLRR
jgi:predicted kinase